MTSPKPPFQRDRDTSLEDGIYQPVAPNPSGLRLAWLLVGLSVLVRLYLLFFDLQVPALFWIASILLLLVALAITFSNWLERRTTIEISAAGVQFRSPLRKVGFSWPEVEWLQCGPLQNGWRFLVGGSKAAFRYQSLTILRSGAGREVRTGFPEGQQIAHRIYQDAGLDELGQQDDLWLYRRPS